MGKDNRIALILAVVLFGCMLGVGAAEDMKKVLYIDSYSAANFWSARLEKGIRSVLSNRDNIQLKIFRMDTKRFRDENAIKEIALQAKALIDEWQPDVVIASDDNASKHIIVPYYMNSDVPFVFCGVNFDASHYGFPAANVTGMIEVVMLDEAMELMRQYAAGDRVGFLASDNFSAHKAYQYLVENEGKVYAEAEFVSSFDELKKTFMDMQQKVDMIYLLDVYSVDDFDYNEMIEFSEMNTLVPTSASLYSAIKYSLLGTTKSPFEHGAWSAQTALEILGGKSPSEIPVTKNKRGKLYLNMDIARKLGIKFPIELIDNASLINKKDKKVMYLSFYPEGNVVNKEIKSGVMSALGIEHIGDNVFDNTNSEVDFRIFNKDLVGNYTKFKLKNLVEEAVAAINTYKPDVVIATYDSLLMQLLKEYNKSLYPAQFVLCGLGWELAQRNECKLRMGDKLEQFSKMISFLQENSMEKKIGYIGAGSILSGDLLELLVEKYNLKFEEGAVISTFDEFKNEFLAMQDNVDIVCIFETCNICDWSEDAARDFFRNNTRVPTVAFNTDYNRNYFLRLGQGSLLQGVSAGGVALDIVKNNSLFNRPVCVDIESDIYLSQEFFDKFDIDLPAEFTEIIKVIK